jgi:hypothetical protein
MKLIIAGSRGIDARIAFYYTYKWQAKNHLEVTELISGTASGPDRVPLLMKGLGSNVPVKEFPADWNKYGKRAGMLRNLEMAKYADALLLIWDGESRGSANMKLEMERLGKPVHEIIVKG